jgi:hypothetical protein
MIVTHKPTATWEELQQVKVTVPANAGGVWCGCRYDTLVEYMLKEGERRQWALTHWVFVPYMNGAEFTGSCRVAFTAGKAPEPPAGYRYAMGWVTGNNRRKRLRFYMGLIRKEPRYGIVLEELRLGKKHALGNDVKEMVEAYFGAYKEVLPGTAGRIEALKDIKLTGAKACQYVAAACRVGDRGVAFPWSRAGAVDALYLTGGDYTAWGLYSAYCAVATRNTPYRQMSQMNYFSELLLGERPMAKVA